MNPAAPGGGSAADSAQSADLLTRTTLSLIGSPSVPSIASVTHALQRVPGVLLAEVNAAGSRALVAHDSAVKPEALLAAAAGAGLTARIESGGARAAGRPGPPLNVRYLQLSAIAMFPLVIFATGSLLLRGDAGTYWPLVLCCLFIVLFALGRRGA